MANIIVNITIAAPIERVFDLARSIDAHLASTSRTQEKAIDGNTTGLIEMDDTVTFEAVHFWVRQKFCAKIVAFDRPHFFVDEMVSGAFKSMNHTHNFSVVDGGVLMTDILVFEAPLGVLGWIAEKMFLARYMKNFLIERGEKLKEMAEGDEWKEYLYEENNL